MKKLVLAILTAFQIMACTVVRFETPQPAGVVGLPDFPEQMRGFFVSEDQDTLEITEFEFHFKDRDEIGMRGDLTSGETVLKEFNKHHILNLKNEGKWDIFPVKLRKGNIHVYFPATASRAEELMEQLKRTSSVKEIPDADGDFDYYLIDPTARELQYLIRKNLFDERIIFKRLK